VKREYKIVLLTYLIMQLSSPVGVPFTYYLLNGLGFSGKDLESRSLSLWLLFSFSAAFIVTLYCLRREMRFRSQKAASFPVSAFWAAAGVFLALFGQLAAARIEMLFGVEPGSENTREIIGMIEKAPAIFLVAAVFGPVLEEVVFRKIIFGTCMQRLGFFPSALISSLFFSAAHREFEHLLLYTAIGFAFCYVYRKTNRILVPIFSHVSMNVIAILSQLDPKIFSMF